MTPNALPLVKENIRKAHKSAKDERLLRGFVVNVAMDCPAHILQALGQCLVDIREQELRDEALSN